MASLLLIEDETALRRLISWSLLEAGHEVAVVPDADAAFARLATYQPDIIIFNTVIGDEDKVKAIGRLRMLAPGCRVLDVSEEKNTRERGIIGVWVDGASADASLDLPFPKERLLEAIDRLLEIPR